MELTIKEISKILSGESVVKDGIEIRLSDSLGTLGEFLETCDINQKVEIMGECSGFPKEIISSRPDLLKRKVKSHWSSVWGSLNGEETKTDIVLE